MGRGRERRESGRRREMVKARWAYARSRGLGTTAPSVVIQLARAQPRRPGPAAPNANGLTTLSHTTPVMAAQQNGNAPQGSAGDADLAQVLPCTATRPAVPRLSRKKLISPRLSKTSPAASKPLPPSKTIWMLSRQRSRSL